MNAYPDNCLPETYPRVGGLHLFVGVTGVELWWQDKYRGVDLHLWFKHKIKMLPKSNVTTL